MTLRAALALLGFVACGGPKESSPPPTTDTDADSDTDTDTDADCVPAGVYGDPLWRLDVGPDCTGELLG